MKKIGGIVFQNFGLRKEWIYEFFENRTDFLENSSLGNRQVESLKQYLKHIELIDKRGRLTEGFNILSELYKKEGINSLNLWSILWINLYFNSLLFSWYGILPLGEYKRNDIIKRMEDDYGRTSKIYLGNGYLALAGTFERTPIGKDLRIGIVKKEGRSRIIEKRGGFEFYSYILLYALYKFSEKYGEYEIDLEEIKNNRYSPQKVLVISSEKAKQILLEIYNPDIISFKNNKILLYSSIKSYDIIKIIARR